MSQSPARIDPNLRATSPRYKAITFDVGGTLIEPWPSVGHVYAGVASRHGMTKVAPETLNRRFAVAWQQRKDFRHTRAEWRALVEATFNASISSAFFSDLYEEFGKAVSWRIFEDVSPALDLLASLGIKLGVVSNWDERLRPLLRQFELYDRFDAIIVSNEVGFPKPSEVIFRQAAESLGLVETSILHVGDSFTMDVEGARAAGFAALRVCRHTEPRSAHEIKSLSELTKCFHDPIA